MSSEMNYSIVMCYIYIKDRDSEKAEQFLNNLEVTDEKKKELFGSMDFLLAVVPVAICIRAVRKELSRLKFSDKDLEENPRKVVEALSNSLTVI